jgi:CHASE3 domain sensor protein
MEESFTMTIQPSSEKTNGQDSTVAGKFSILGLFKNLNIGRKLTLGFGILVALMFLSAGVSYLGSDQATTKINRTDEVRVPVALAASHAQADLLQMQADVRGYLALGDPVYRERYNESKEMFEADMADLIGELSSLDAENQQRLKEIEVTYNRWSELPEQLFELRDDQLEREPAYRLLVTEGTKHAGQVLIDIGQMIELQGQREPTAENLDQLKDMAKFQGNFAAMLSAQRGYVTTRNRLFRVEYEVNLTDNENAWERLSGQRDELTSSQQELLDNIAQEREAFLLLPEQMFADLESERWREDLYIFSTEAVPLANDMQGLLNDLVADQQGLLTDDLADGRSDLSRANRLILAGGFVALVVGIALAFIFRATIAGPVHRLTHVAEQIRQGDLDAQAQVESGDEVGTLARTFNNMTGRLRETLLQVRKEKKRADDLLEVVIPIGVDLASEKDFNRLLEKMLLEAKSFCHADAGVLYWLTEDNRLEFVIVRNDTLNIARGGTTGEDITYTQLLLPLPLYDQTTGEANHGAIATHVALSGATLNIPHIDQQTGELQFSGNEVFGRRSDYRAISHLAFPLKNSENHVIGVMQLINAQDPDANQIVPFDQNLQQMMESFSSLAVAALEAYVREQSLKQEIQQLRIEIDEVKRQREVSEIVEADEFKTLKARAQDLRRRRQAKQEKPDDTERDS